ncbi:MAG: hypothetical protein NTW86_30325, partial [Candidatus Sumerlaeota bacterium]|nr:hypothetical protein [Candidatus Sumerlaeota bacterium]
GKWAGKSVTLRFIADCGPKNSSTADHSGWAEVALGGAGAPYKRSPYTPGRIMAFASSDPTTASFYFRDAGPATVDLTIECEGTEPLRISEFTVHGAADALAREFEHGAVLVNPSMRDYAFDLAKIFPGAKLCRFQGTELQDPKTNNGQPVGESVTLGERDGLFLTKE